MAIVVCRLCRLRADSLMYSCPSGRHDGSSFVMFREAAGNGAHDGAEQPALRSDNGGADAASETELEADPDLEAYLRVRFFIGRANLGSNRLPALYSLHCPRGGLYAVDSEGSGLFLSSETRHAKHQPQAPSTWCLRRRT